MKWLISLFRKKPLKTQYIDGVMWDGANQRSLSKSEYEHWMITPLPFGWAIISEPTPF